MFCTFLVLAQGLSMAFLQLTFFKDELHLSQKNDRKQRKLKNKDKDVFFLFHLIDIASVLF